MPRKFDAFWRRHGLGRIAGLKWLVEPESRDEMFYVRLGAGDIYHPAGSTRIGADRSEAVVDRNLRTLAVPNLWVASTSAFPSLGTANPTLTLMLLALRLGDHLAA